MEKKRKIRLAFFYNEFFPVRGGASVHGYNLAKELTNIGYKVITLNRIDNGFTEKKNRTLFSLVKVLVDSDLLYIRHGLSIGFMSYLILISKILNKKIIVELNAVSDELRINGKNDRYIKSLDKKLKFFFSFVDAMVVVSRSVKKYCEEALSYNKASVVPNGGEIINVEDLIVKQQLIKDIEKIRRKHKKLVIWSGMKTPWQGYDILIEIINRSNGDTGFIFITNDSSSFDEVAAFQNVHIFYELCRDEVKYLIKQCHIGLSLYGDYSWCKYGFYGSSLKYYEYLINGLFVVASPEGEMSKDKFPNLFISNCSEEIVNYINEVDIGQKFDNIVYRSWKDVAKQVDSLIKDVLRK